MDELIRAVICLARTKMFGSMTGPPEHVPPQVKEFEALPSTVRSQLVYLPGHLAIGDETLE